MSPNISPVALAASLLDKYVEHLDRYEKTQAEKDYRNGVMFTPDYQNVEWLHGADATPAEKTAIVRALYWDILRDLPHETALYLVLNSCMGYSKAEIAAGMNVSYARVKYLCGGARMHGAIAELER